MSIAFCAKGLRAGRENKYHPYLTPPSYGKRLVTQESTIQAVNAQRLRRFSFSPPFRRQTRRPAGCVGGHESLHGSARFIELFRVDGQ